MLKNLVTLMMTIFLALGFGSHSEAKSKKSKNSKMAYVSKKTKKKSKKNKNRRFSRRYKKSGNGPDLRALTTESPDSPYTDKPDNGVNSVETKPGI